MTLEHGSKSPHVVIVSANGTRGLGGISQGLRTTLAALAATPSCYSATIFPSRYLAHRKWSDVFIPFRAVHFFFFLMFTRPDLVHIKLSVGASPLRKAPFFFLARAFCQKTIIQVHGGGFDDYVKSAGWPVRKLIIKMLSSADEIIALSPWWANYLSGISGHSRERVHVIENAVTDPGPPVRNASPNEKPVILFLGELGDRKGVPELLRALATDEMRGLSWRAIIAGQGDKTTYEKMAQKLKLSDRVQFTGWVARTEVNRLLRRADIFVLPSRAENQPNSVLEALAFGVPVVATPVGAIPEVLEDGVSGHLVPVGDVEALARGLEWLVREPVARLKLGDSGRSVYEARFKPNVQVVKFADVYHKALNR